MSKATFGEIFENTWSTFKGNYGACLLFTLILVILGLVASIVILIIGINTSDVDQPLNMLLATAGANWLINGVVIYPIFALLAFTLVQKVRGESGRKDGAFIRVLIITTVCGFFATPSFILSGLANPGQYEQLKMLPEYISTSLEQVTLEANNEHVDANGERTQKAIEIETKLETLGNRTEVFEAMKNNNYSVISSLYGLIAFLILIRFQPWAMMIACDPNTEERGAAECMSAGWSLGAGSYIGSTGALILFSVIAFLSTLACFLPGIFFGIPLLMAWLPGVYLLLSQIDKEIPPVVDELHG